MGITLESIVKGGIPMDWVRTINDAIEYMEQNLTNEVTLADIEWLYEGSGTR